MNEQEISKWGPEEIANTLELIAKDQPTDDLKLVNRQAVKLLREYATKQERKGNSKEKVYEALDKYMEMLPELLDRLFPKIPEMPQGLGDSELHHGGAFMPIAPVQMPKEKWIITQDATINFSAMASQILCVENVIDGHGGYLHLTFQFGLDKILSGEAATKFNGLWKEEMKKRKEQGRIETV